MPTDVAAHSLTQAELEGPEVNAREAIRFVVSSVVQGLLAVLAMAVLGPLALTVVQGISGHVQR